MRANQPSQSSSDQIMGLVERVTFFNEETGFCVLRVKAKDHRDLVTVVGSVSAVTPGEWVTAEGNWVIDKEHGRQLKATLLKCIPPTTREGIEKYLGGGIVKGIGPVYAKKLVKAFGEDIFEVIENRPKNLEAVQGIGPRRRVQITNAWADQKVVREIMLFLHSHGVSTSRAVRIYKTYGADAIERVRSNPYTLAKDIHGIGFKSADQIAQNVGISKDSPIRARAGLNHVLWEATNEGHCALPVKLLQSKAVEMLGVDEGIVEQALGWMVTKGDLIHEQINDQDLIFLPYLLKAEEEIASTIRRLAESTATYPKIDFASAVSWCQAKTGKNLAESQVAALRQVLSHRAVVITGGPGVGKTTLINSILMILRAKKVKCLLCAPTGRAAKRLTETTGLEAKTIHRLLEVQPGFSRFARNEKNPLECNLLVVDESSMLDMLLMSDLLRALPRDAGLILVGDVDQLPSVGPGMVLRHIIQSGVIPVVKLTEVFRQSQNSQIVISAHSINKGVMPTERIDSNSDFYFIERADSEKTSKTLLDLIQTLIPKKFKFHPIRDVQVLCPMNRGLLGIRELNGRLQAALNPPSAEKPEIQKFGWIFRKQDKVIQTENNYEKEVFNGDIGQIEAIDLIEREVAVRFDNRVVVYDYGELDEISPAYAITIHKSQGSEFPVVVIPLAMEQYMLLQRNLIYTAITRGKKLVVTVGQRKAFRMAVKNNRTGRRYSGLLHRLKPIATAADL